MKDIEQTESFEELDNLAEDMGKSFPHLDTEEQRQNDPARKKWKTAVDKLPKEKKKRYYEKAYQESRKEQSERRKHFEHLDRVAEGVRGLDVLSEQDKKNHPNWRKLQHALKKAPKKIRHEWKNEKYQEAMDADLSDKRSVFFTFAEAAKANKLQEGFDFADQQVKQEKEKNNGKSDTASLHIPEMVSIDYSEYSDIPMFKNNVYAKPYRDGIMLVTDVEKAHRCCIALTVGTVTMSGQLMDKRNNRIMSLKEDEEDKEAPQLDGKKIAGIHDSSFRNFGQIDWTNKNFDEQVVFYVVVPKIIKHKAARIVFRNNIHLNKVIKLFRSESQRKLPLGEFKHFYDSTKAAHVVLAGLHVCRQQTDPIKASNLKKSYDYSNRELLNAGYQSVLIELANNGVMSSGDDIQLTEKNFWSRLENYKNKSLKELKQEYMKDIFPFEKDLDLVSLRNIDHKDKKVDLFFNKNLLKMVTLYYHTNKGTTLCDGTEINTKIKTKSDCILFWKKINLFELLFNVLNDKNFP